MKLVGKRVLITGGAGFIGSHLVDALADNNTVTVVDNLCSGKLENIRSHLDNGKITFFNADITNRDEMRKLVRDYQIVFHLAVQCLRVSLMDPYLVHEVNATGTLNVCQAALEAKVERLVYISSSEVYGTAKTVPMNEDHPLEPTTPYGASKLAGEAYARSYYLAMGLPVIIVRPFNSYGPRAHMEGVYGEVIPRFVLRVMNGLAPIIFGGGQQTRDFTHVSDIARGIALACECDSLIGGTVNIAAGREVSINQLASTIIGLLGYDGKLTPLYAEARPGDVRRHYADITKSQRFLGYQPSVQLEEGLRHYIAWVKNQSLDFKHLMKNEVIFNWRPASND